MFTWSIPPVTHLKSQRALVTGGRFKGRKVEILPENYLGEGFWLIRDLEFGIELTMRKENITRRPE